MLAVSSGEFITINIPNNKPYSIAHCRIPDLENDNRQFVTAVFIGWHGNKVDNSNGARCV